MPEGSECVIMARSRLLNTRSRHLVAAGFAVTAAVALLLWVGVLASGRLIAYL